VGEIKLKDRYLEPLDDADGTPVHFGTSVDGIPIAMNLEVVVPSSVTPVLTDLLTFFSPGQKVVCKLYEIDTGGAPSAGDAPIYFGVGFRSGITSIDCINLFCHPSPATPAASMFTPDYIGLKGNWSKLFRYIPWFGVQLAQAASNMVVVMPMFTIEAWQKPTKFNAQWEDVLNAIIAEIFRLIWPDFAGPPPPLKDLILSDFSAGRLLMTQIRPAPHLAAFLREIWDFDGAQAAVPSVSGAIRLIHYAKHFSGRPKADDFHLPVPRWRNAANFRTCMAEPTLLLQIDCIHGNFPRLFLHAAKRSGFGH
jgi:hypothetical protein